jgi:hypothetical protein
MEDITQTGNSDAIVGNTIEIYLNKESKNWYNLNDIFYLK